MKTEANSAKVEVLAEEEMTGKCMTLSVVNVGASAKCLSGQMEPKKSSVVIVLRKVVVKTPDRREVLVIEDQVVVLN